MLIDLSSIQSILVYSGGELIGDGMLKWPFIKALRHLFPKAQIHWLTAEHKTVYRTVMKEMVAPYIDVIYEQTFLGCKKSDLLMRPWKTYLPSYRFDLIIDLEHKLIPTLCIKQIPHKYFLSSSARWLFSLLKPMDREKPKRFLDRIMKLLSTLCGKEIVPDFSIPIPEKDDALARELLSSLTQPIALLAPGAGGKYKCWPLNNFIELSRRLKEKGISSAFILGPQEADWMELIKKDLPNALFPLQMAPYQSPTLTIALSKHSNISVGNDAGVAHLLAAGEKPMVSLFGPTPSSKFIPNSSKVSILSTDMFEGGTDMSAIPINAVLDTVVHQLGL